MENIAFKKKILEKWKHPEEATNGNTKDYPGGYGYAWDYYPNTFTLDLEDKYEIDTIRFLLFDLERNRIYKYRLLTSHDLKNWVVHYDTRNTGTIGWQIFKFTPKILTRYIRIHALWNSINEGFHIVQIEVFKKKPSDLNVENCNEQLITKIDVIENGDGLFLTPKLNLLIKDLEELPEKYKGLDSEYFKDIISKLRIQTRDVESIETSLSSVKRQIIDPVKKEIESTNKISKTSVKFGIIGGIIGIISILISIFAILNYSFSWI